MLKKQQMNLNVCCSLMIVMSAVMLSQVDVGDCRARKVWANSVGDFNMFDCAGEFNHEVFSELNYICDECYNVYRPNRDVYVECRANCFRNSRFPKCVSDLLYDHKMEDYEKKINKVFSK